MRERRQGHWEGKMRIQKVAHDEEAEEIVACFERRTLRIKGSVDKLVTTHETAASRLLRRERRMKTTGDDTRNAGETSSPDVSQRLDSQEDVCGYVYLQILRAHLTLTLGH